MKNFALGIIMSLFIAVSSVATVYAGTNLPDEKKKKCCKSEKKECKDSKKSCSEAKGESKECEKKDKKCCATKSQAQ